MGRKRERWREGKAEAECVMYGVRVIGAWRYHRRRRRHRRMRSIRLQ